MRWARDDVSAVTRALMFGRAWLNVSFLTQPNFESVDEIINHQTSEEEGNLSFEDLRTFV